MIDDNDYNIVNIMCKCVMYQCVLTNKYTNMHTITINMTIQ